MTSRLFQFACWMALGVLLSACDGALGDPPTDDPAKVVTAEAATPAHVPPGKPEKGAQGGTKDDGPAYFVERFMFAPATPWLSELPAFEKLLDSEVSLQEVENGWIAVRDQNLARRVKIRSLTQLPKPWFY